MYDNSLGRRISAMSIIICYLKSVKVGRLWECSSKGRTYLTHIDVTPLYIREGRLDAIEKSTFDLMDSFSFCAFFFLKRPILYWKISDRQQSRGVRRIRFFKKYLAFEKATHAVVFCTMKHFTICKWLISETTDMVIWGG